MTNTFEEEMEKQRNLARSARKTDITHNHDNIITDNIEKTIFEGYDNFIVDGLILAIFKDSEQTQSINQGDEGIVITNKTSFYPEGGGQVADTGYIKTDKASLRVLDVQKKNDIILHYVKVEEGEISVGDEAELSIDIERRLDIQRNHSATHLLDQALKDVLGTDIKQAGSLVDQDKLRFDFSYNKPVSKDQLRKVEKIVNQKIREQEVVKKEYMDYKKSEEIGAIGLFEDKYKDIVRVVSMGDYSKELCGGCHVNNTAEILIFKIISESSAAAGIRRIEAITGKQVYNYLLKEEDKIEKIAKNLDTTVNNIYSKIKSVNDDLSRKELEIKRLKSQSNKDIYKELNDKVKNINGVNLLISKFENISMDELRDLENRFKNQYDNLIIVFASVGDKITFTVSVDDNLTDRYNAGKIVREIAQITSGNGGGRKNFAQAGGSDITLLDKALEKAYELIKE